MKSSTGVTICAVILLMGAALSVFTAAGMAYMFMGPLSSQLLDPANLPPGADLRMMRAAGLAGAVMIGAFGTVGVATGIGLLRLWKWARYAAIVLGVLVIVGSAVPGLAVLFTQLPPPPGANGNVAGGIRIVVGAFYLLWAATGVLFVYWMARKSTAAQFNGGDVEAIPRARPISVSIIAWFMIVSAAMGLPIVAMMHLPAFVFGLLLTGSVAKAYYIIYFSLFALFGLGLLKRTSEALAPSIGLHSFAMANALIMAVPSVWAKYQDAIRSMSLFGTSTAATAPAWARYYSVGFGVILPAVVIYFLWRARRRLPAPAAATRTSG